MKNQWVNCAVYKKFPNNLSYLTSEHSGVAPIDFLSRIIVVVYTYRGDEIRLISARPATKVERKSYEKRRI